jgi:hypothetical protein
MDELAKPAEPARCVGNSVADGVADERAVLAQRRAACHADDDA